MLSPEPEALTTKRRRRAKQWRTQTAKGGKEALLPGAHHVAAASIVTAEYGRVVRHFVPENSNTSQADDPRKTDRTAADLRPSTRGYGQDCEDASWPEQGRRKTK